MIMLPVEFDVHAADVGCAVDSTDCGTTCLIALDGNACADRSLPVVVEMSTTRMSQRHRDILTVRLLHEPVKQHEGGPECKKDHSQSTQSTQWQRFFHKIWVAPGRAAL
ncbi:hypothetical protein INR49_016771 [Caranx melampygus]|nr:hypothetical protein INR49_016771 [Caranx melampygus]